MSRPGYQGFVLNIDIALISISFVNGVNSGQEPFNTVILKV